jgi:fermentation-respiration switch protein FrsA (DUF1100 family)
LVFGGGADRHTTPEETRRLFAAAPEPKRLWIVPGAAHGDFQAASPAEYRRQVLDFLDWSLVPTLQQPPVNAQSSQP